MFKFKKFVTEKLESILQCLRLSLRMLTVVLSHVNGVLYAGTSFRRQRICASLRSTAYRPFAVLTDLRDTWILFWLDGKTVFNFAPSRLCAIGIIQSLLEQVRWLAHGLRFFIVTTISVFQFHYFLYHHRRNCVAGLMMPSG